MDSITSVASVFLRSSSTVLGDVTTEGSITKQNDVTVSGQESTEAILSPPSQISWSLAPAGDLLGDVLLEPGDARRLSPGTYGHVSVKTGARLSLEPGEYQFADLDVLEPGAYLLAETEAAPVVIYVEGSVTVRGSVLDAAGDGSGLMIVMLGTGAAMLESAFHGTLIAPYGTINLGTAGGEAHMGSFYGKDVVVAGAGPSLRGGSRDGEHGRAVSSDVHGWRRGIGRRDLCPASLMGYAARPCERRRWCSCWW